MPMPKGHKVLNRKCKPFDERKVSIHVYVKRKHFTKAEKEVRKLIAQWR